MGLLPSQLIHFYHIIYTPGPRRAINTFKSDQGTFTPDGAQGGSMEPPQENLFPTGILQ